MKLNRPISNIGAQGSNDPLAALRDIRLPQDPGWWPPAVGWWVVAALVIVLLLWLSGLVLDRWRRRAPGREFRQALLALDLDGEEPTRALQSMSALTRRYLISLYGRQRVASLTGSAWLNTLDRLTGKNMFNGGPGQILATGPYIKAAPDRAALLAVRQCLLDLVAHRPQTLTEFP